MENFLKALIIKFNLKSNNTGIEFAQSMLDIILDGGTLTNKQLEWCKKNAKMHRIAIPGEEDDKELCKTFNVPSISEANRRLRVLSQQTTFDAVEKNIEVQAVKLIGALDTALSEVNTLREEMLKVLKEIEINYPSS